ncbi:MAG TPA: transporter [Clostridiales bacterium]|nr:transporter [Clostridiales bacterium]
MREIALGQYYPVDSVLHRLDPRTKIVLMIAYITMIFFVKTFIGFGIVFVFLAAAILLSRVPVGKVLKSLKTIMFLVLFTVIMSLLFYAGKEEDLIWRWGIIKVYRAGLINAGLMALRLMFLVVGPTLLTFTTTPVALTDGLESLLKPLTYIKFPVHELAMIMSIALRLIPTLVEETDKIQSAQKARCADFDSGNVFKRAKAMIPVLIPLFVSSFRRADELADAMDSRCYRGAKGRTRMKKLKFHIRDLIAVLFLAVFFFAVLWLRYNFFPWVIDLSSIPWIM